MKQKKKVNRIVQNIYIGTFLSIVFFTFLFIPVINFVYAQDSSNVDARRAELERDLAELEKQINLQRELLRGKEGESASLERDIAIIEAQINKKRLEIKSRNIAIANLGEDIDKKDVYIDILVDQMEKDRQSLGGLIRRTHELDSLSLVEIILMNKSLSEFFSEVDTFELIQGELKRSFDELRKNKTLTEKEIINLEKKQDEELRLRSIQVQEKSRIEKAEAQKEDLLEITKGEEDVYKHVISVKEKTAAQIRTELFTLRGSSAIPFGEALDLANRAFEETGVRPALILGVLAEESNLGENVGTGNWREDMKAPRDTVPFLDITSRLGLDPDQMPVSKKPWYGWGGAMGPAQFIPSTWILFEDKIAKLTGHDPPNPWLPEDAIMASAILLKDNGAAAGGYTAERLATLRYFAGWVNAEKPLYAFYGDEVMSLATKYQGLIDILQGS